MTFQLYLKNESQITHELFDWTEITYREVLNGRGGWVLTAPEEAVSDHFRRLDWDHTNASTGRLNGAGIVVADRGEYVYHGVRHASPNYRRDGVTANEAHPANIGEGIVGSTIRGAGDRKGTASIAGVDDLGWLANRVYVPGAAASGEYPEVSGNPGVLIPDLVESQIGAAALIHRRLPNWSFATATIAGGSSVTMRPAFGNLLATCNDYLSRWDGDPLYMKLTQTESGLLFSVEEMTLTADTYEIGSGLNGSTMEITPSAANTVYAAAFDASGNLDVTHYSALARSWETMPDFDFELGYEVVEVVADLGSTADGEADTSLVDSTIGGAVNLGGSSFVVTPTPDVARQMRVGSVVSVLVEYPEYAKTASKEGELLQLPVTETTTTVNVSGARTDLVTLGPALANPLVPSEDYGRPFFPASR